MQLDHQGDSLLVVSERGIGKRTRLEEFNIQHRGGKGVKCYKITEKTGNLVGVKAVNDDHEIMIITSAGVIIQIPMGDISTIGRHTSGVKLINLDKKVTVAKIAKVREKISDGNQEFDDIEEALEEVQVDPDDDPAEENLIFPVEQDEDDDEGNGGSDE
jgi:DNA gyrase subunit A